MNQSEIENLIVINGKFNTEDAHQIARSVTKSVSQHKTDIASLFYAVNAELLPELNRFAAIETGLRFQPSTLPLIGGFINYIKTAFHQLILYYIRDLAKQQTQFNQHLVRFLWLERVVAPSEELL